MQMLIFLIGIARAIRRFFIRSLERVPVLRELVAGPYRFPLDYN